MSDLSQEEKYLLKELSRNPVFSSILSKVAHKRVRPWKRTGDDEQKKLHDWIYTSGVDDGVQIVLKQLRYEND